MFSKSHDFVSLFLITNQDKGIIKILLLANVQMQQILLAENIVVL